MMEERGKSNRGYSIWSLLLIMTLLAIVLAIPRQSIQPSFGRDNATFLLCHQLLLWSLGAVCVWLMTGKRSSVRLVVAATVLVVWLPLMSALLEDAITGNATTTWSVLTAIGLSEGYGMFYQAIYRMGGYGPAN